MSAPQDYVPETRRAYGLVHLAIAVAIALPAYWFVPPSDGDIGTGWAATGLFCGLYFARPYSVLRGRFRLGPATGRFCTAFLIAALFHLATCCALLGAEGKAMILFMIPVLMLPIFLRPGTGLFRADTLPGVQLLGGSNSRRSFLRKARG